MFLLHTKLKKARTSGSRSNNRYLTSLASRLTAADNRSQTFLSCRHFIPLRSGRQNSCEQYVADEDFWRERSLEQVDKDGIPCTHVYKHCVNQRQFYVIDEYPNLGPHIDLFL